MFIIGVIEFTMTRFLMLFIKSELYPTAAEKRNADKFYSKRQQKQNKSKTDTNNDL